MGIGRKEKQLLDDIVVSENAADRELKEAQARKANAEADLLDLEYALIARATQLSLDSDEYCEYHFAGDVDHDSVTDCLAQLKYWDRQAPECPFNIELTSQGGSVWDGCRLFDYLVDWSIRGGGSHEITIRVRGIAASMASVLLQAADHRVMGRGSVLMIHESAMNPGFGRKSALEDALRALEVEERFSDPIFAERAGLSVEEFRELYRRRDLWLTPDEALTIGFIDRIG
ncbi:ATP-dependent Clp protease proteolytic subunit [Mycobacteroides immunogenum]|uniref:ATP-dependent Clp protease proteolytic subunit n=1 Tax=Mycobacteroides immunogenum TaxID=83262 RepID=A0A7V8LQU1_9MYCO|nr:ATP-dependent Clp protease proteolytic subunit [Mycobacteroides immunogenum]KPG13724.1 hypothetical protein AN909_05545 [Mycobacteroides immunogenum]KPG14287.1 hypothetical protein AN908_06860 [Mycobacteroides immunogenum]KPG14359.1 hypothetical protein AN908_07340 [Mycobacteroides immunogenum]KPG17438.1 hypothetical protein AN910_04770 [Mycobacteroides immunogenum]KPG23978.1 hypothetical protein AN911_00390 [Mycobacteroides immunogenum]